MREGAELPGNWTAGAALSRSMLLNDARRVEHFAAMVLIGDGVMALVHPSKDADAWKKGPQVWRRLMEALAERPGLTMAIGAAQVAIGVAWALRQSRDHDPRV